MFRDGLSLHIPYRWFRKICLNLFVRVFSSLEKQFPGTIRKHGRQGSPVLLFTKFYLIEFAFTMKISGRCPG